MGRGHKIEKSNLTQFEKWGTFKILQLHAFHETFLDKTSPKKIKRFNRGLNFQWQLILKNQ